MAQYVTLSTLRSRAREEADMENGTFVSDSEANRYVNEAITELSDFLISMEDHPWESKRVFLFVPKNYPAICLAQRTGFRYAGYSDLYYPDQDIALFFAVELG